eukprot:672496_1
MASKPAFPFCPECPNDVSELTQFMQNYAIYSNATDNDLYIHQKGATKWLKIFLHLLERHNTDEQFELIMSQCGNCDIKTCSIFKRHYRDKTQSTGGYPKYSDTGSLQIMDKIHCFYSHCHDIGNKLLIRERTDIEQKDEKQDDHEENDDVHFINESIAKRSQLLSTKREMHEEYIGSSTRFCNKFNQLNVEQASDDDADKKDKMYCFGSEFVYDYEDEYIFNHDNYTAIQKTYDSLRQELTQNTITINKFL